MTRAHFHQGSSDHFAEPKRTAKTYELSLTHGQVHYLLAVLEEFDGPKNDAGEPWGRNRRAAVLAKLNGALNAAEPGGSR